MKKLFLLFLLISPVALAQKKASADLDKKIKDFDLYAQTALKQWDVPGAALVVIKDGQVLLKKGYGVRELGKQDAVNTETLFSCASTTKAMTATCMGMLVDEGKVKWSDPVIQYLPEFQLYDPYVTRELRIRDLFIHDSGVGNADFLWSVMDITDDEVLKKMRMVKPSYSMRSSFIYQNIFYMAAGKVIEKITGKPWETFIQERLFTPLGMSRAVAKRKYIKDDNQTRPHFKVGASILAIGYTKDDAVGPAGSVWASIDDMSKWALCMLDSSKYSGGRLLKAATWNEMFKPQTMVPPNEFYPTAQITKPNWTTYGLGWFQHDYQGHKVNFHTGSLAGLVAIHAQLPDQKLAFYIFENYDHAEVRHALMYKAFDTFALGGSRDWSTEFLKLYTGIRTRQEAEVSKFESQRALNTQPALPVEKYQGKYSDPLYGEVQITVASGKMTVKINNFESATLEHWNYDTFYGTWEKKWYGKAVATFSVAPTGKVEKVNFEGMEFRKSDQ